MLIFQYNTTLRILYLKKSNKPYILNYISGAIFYTFFLTRKIIFFKQTFFFSLTNFVAFFSTIFVENFLLNKILFILSDKINFILFVYLFFLPK